MASGGAIITQGDEGDAMYFIEEGEAEAVIKGVGVVMSYKRGDFFGELALMTAEPRSATVRLGARSRCRFVVMSGGANCLYCHSSTLHRSGIHFTPV